ncbi:unnamed protein product, partial [Rotaria sp. Silwood1]
VAAQLRKDTIELDVLNSRDNQERLDQTLLNIETDEDVLEVYKTDPLRYHRSLIIYLNELSQCEPTIHGFSDTEKNLKRSCAQVNVSNTDLFSR